MSTRIAACVAVAVAAAALAARQQPPAAAPTAPPTPALVSSACRGRAPRRRPRRHPRSRPASSPTRSTRATPRRSRPCGRSKASATTRAGEPILGRAAIEKTFADVLQGEPGVKIEVLIEVDPLSRARPRRRGGSPAAGPPGKDLPATTLYSVDARPRGRARGGWPCPARWGAGQDRLEDLDWLVGEWKAHAPGPGGDAVVRPRRGEAVHPGRSSRNSQGARPSLPADDAGSASTRRPGQSALVALRRRRRPRPGPVGPRRQPLGARLRRRARRTARRPPVNVLGRVNDDAITWRSIDRVTGRPGRCPTPCRSGSRSCPAGK